MYNMNKEQIKNELKPTNDIIFKRLFGKKGNERIVKDFLEGVLDTKIEKVELGKETQLLPDKIDEKIGILDVRVTLENSTSVDIEMQNINYGNITKRVTYYLNQLYTSELSRGKNYTQLNKAIVIAILNFDYFEDIEEYHTVWKITEQHNKDKTLEEQEIHFVEIPKFLKSKIDVERKLDQWMLFIDYSRRELLKMAEEKNNMIREASAEYEYLTGDEEVQRLAFLRRKFELDYNSGMQCAEDRGIEKGRKEGIEKGRKEGKEEGKKANQLEVAKKLKEKGAEVDFIVEITGLSKEEIERL